MTTNRSTTFRHAVGYGATMVNITVELDDEWRNFAKCSDPKYSRLVPIEHVGKDGEIITGPNIPLYDWDGEHTAEHPERTENARAVCQTCPVRSDCLEHALRVQEPSGIWGGMTEEERFHELGLRKTSTAKRNRKRKEQAE